MKKILKIGALSDLHGHLPDPSALNGVDVWVLCGDIVHLEYQRSESLSLDWYSHEFAEWVKALDCKKVIMIGGNHDFFLYEQGKGRLNTLFERICGDKLVYLEDELYEYEGITFYGCPWCTGPLNWAFSPGQTRRVKEVFSVDDFYNKIPDCDILLTHQPPSVGKISTSMYWDRNQAHDWGSDRLRLAIKDKKIGINFCGHVHSGDHELTLYPTIGCDTKFYNVSYLDERYWPAYDPRYIFIETDTKRIYEVH
jgi:Icc-related predicted phosphoesterase